MPVTMQGSWTVSVKSKEAAYPQRFIISGAISGNGTYAGAVATPAVPVTGDNWIITIQNNPGSGFVESDVRIKFPTVSGGQYRFDIESNDAWTGDQDFDDLVLACSTPQTLTDFLLYGNVSYYGSGCIFNPCFRRAIVIDSRVSLAEAMRNPLLKKPIERLYADRLHVYDPPRPGPIPDPPPLIPLIIPIDEGPIIPAKEVQVLRISGNLARLAATAKAKTRAAEEAAPVQSFDAVRTVSVSNPAVAKMDIDRVAIGTIVDRAIRFCETGPLPGVLLRFQEYDRTNAEIAGGPYTGEGSRETIGVCATDRNGNYIFRFSRSIAQFLEEADMDVAVGEDEVVQSRPDIIAQLLDPMATTGVAYESAPYWNVPLMRRINICVPKGNLGRLPTACQGENAIQAIGNIFIGAPQADGSRVGFNNFLGSGGRITAKNSLAGTPQARCAAWAGNLDLFACFLDQPDVKYYTIRSRRRLPDLSWGPWIDFQQEYRHPKIANIHLPNYNGDLVGPQPGGVPLLHVGGGAARSAPTYLNIENDHAWVFTHRDRKAVISSWLYAPETGLVQFRIEGYDNAGNKINAADDTIRLFIDNSTPSFQIIEVTMLGQTGGDCALFTLPDNQLDAPITVRFKANQMQGFMNAYGVSVRKGNIGTFAISGTGPGNISGAYLHGDDLICSQFLGTLDDPSSDPFGVVTANIEPAAGNWLEANQAFCTFAVNLGCSTRVTNGYNTAVNSYGPTQYLLGIQK